MVDYMDYTKFNGLYQTQTNKVDVEKWADS